MNTTRLTVTIPKDEFKRIEDEKRRRNLSRSAFIHEIIGSFFKKEEDKSKIARYVAGYRKKPEDIKELSAMEKLQVETLGEF